MLDIHVLYNPTLALLTWYNVIQYNTLLLMANKHKGNEFTFAANNVKSLYYILKKIIQ